MGEYTAGGMPFDVHPCFAYASLNTGNMIVFVHSMLDIWYTNLNGSREQGDVPERARGVL